VCNTGYSAEEDKRRNKDTETLRANERERERKEISEIKNRRRSKKYFSLS
jgi:hypothetical protein